MVPRGEKARSLSAMSLGDGPGFCGVTGAGSTRSSRGRAGLVTSHRVRAVVEALARTVPAGEKAWPHRVPEAPGNRTDRRCGCRGRVTFHRAGWPPNATVATVAPSGEMAAEPSPSKTDRRRRPAGRVTCQRVTLPLNGAPPAL